MPPQDLSEVGRGLAIVQWGFRLVAGAVWLVAVLIVLVATIEARGGQSWVILIGLIPLGASAVGLSAPLGVLVGFIGRVRCLETPPELPIARTRVRLAALLEGCGWLSGVVNCGVAWATAVRSISVPWEVVHAVFGLSFVLFLAGRVISFAYLLALARSVDATPPADSPLLTLMVVVTASTMVFSSVGLLLTSNGHVPLKPEQMVTMGVTFVGTLGVLTGLSVYGRLLRRLREAITVTAHPAE